MHSICQEYYEQRIVELQDQNAAAESDLALLTQKSDALNTIFKLEIRRIAEELATE